MDVRLGPGRDGIDASLTIAAATNARIIFVTGSTEPSTLARIAKDHPFRVIIKPFEIEELREAVCAP